jgi:uncharacterized protein YajQ (UPF0234 family)
MSKAEKIESLLKKSKFKVNIHIEPDDYVVIEVSNISEDDLNLLIKLLDDNKIVMASSFRKLNDYRIVGEIQYTDSNHKIITINGGV